DGFGLPLGFTRLLSHASLPGACAGREPTGTLIGGVGAQPTPTLQKRLARRTGLHVIVAPLRAEMPSGIHPPPPPAARLIPAPHPALVDQRGRAEASEKPPVLPAQRRGRSSLGRGIKAASSNRVVPPALGVVRGG